ncbi:MAG: hypothetical protein HY046_07555 [Acidobacteria bacterium]|nr:hypothetical protein [Acidobacteriota bacterium]
MPMLLGAPTVEQLASIVSGQGPSISWPEQIIPIQGEGTRRPFFCVGGSPLFWPLAQQLGHDQPFLGLVDLPQQQALLLPFPYQLEDIARGLVRVIRAQQTEGPYCIGGWCLEGVLAYETARQLRENENQDVLLILIDTPNPAYYLRIWNANRVTLAARKMRYHVSNLTKLKMADVFAYGVRLANEVKRKARNFGWETSSQIRRHLKKGPQQEPDEIVYLAAMSYQALPFPGRVVFFQSEERPPGEPWNFPLGWRNFVTGKFEVREIKGDHLSILREPDVQTLARLMTSIMEESR